MSKVESFYSSNPNIPVSKKVYHNNNKCTEGNNIESYYLKKGTDNRPLCHRCKELNDEGK